MLDPNFDPYLELQQCKTEVIRQKGIINQLIHAHNQHDSMLLDITNQHKQLVELLKQTKFQVELMRMEINTIRNQHEKKSQSPTTIIGRLLQNT